MIEHLTRPSAERRSYCRLAEDQMTEVDASVQILPTKDRKTQAVTIMTIGGDPDQLSASLIVALTLPWTLAKAIAVGGT